MKNLSLFARSDWSLKKFRDPQTFSRIYFPASSKKFHKPGGIGDKCGFVGYHTRTDWYANTAAALWQMLDDKQIRTFDLEMKRAQLLGLQVPGTCILVDESQDCDACQISWLAMQIEFGSQVYFVGDSAQTIYSFRGAKSSLLMKLNASRSCTLTKSWRFGPAIARMANFVLFAKEKSPQTIGKITPIWDPYRVEGNGNPDDMVTARPIAQNWNHQKVTIIARSNTTLLLEAVKLLGFSRIVEQSSQESGEGTEDSNYDTLKRENYCSLIYSEVRYSDHHYDKNLSHHHSDHFPKFHINGKGRNSGHGKWNSVLKEIELLYELYELSQPEESDGETGPARAIRLDPKIFREFDGETVTWDMFQQRVRNLELNHYLATIGLIENFGRDTMRAMELFKSMVLDQKYKAEEADIILTTAHTAKGQEWDNVQVCDDFIELKINPPDKRCSDIHCQRTRKSRKLLQFTTKSYEDDVNLLYVACTRSKNVLSVPPYLKSLITDFDKMWRWTIQFEERVQMDNKVVRKGGSTDGQDDDGIPGFSEISNPDVETAYQIHDDIVHALRREMGVEKTALIPIFFHGDDTDHSELEVVQVQQLLPS
uniref:UvrD-like helicase ATP-binding domain-containing protein n=1 Tax=Chaetoceros debilis TaxID=122233 RepID=A0A7S3QDK2_9STRA